MFQGVQVGSWEQLITPAVASRNTSCHIWPWVMLPFSFSLLYHHGPLPRMHSQYDRLIKRKKQPKMDIWHECNLCRINSLFFFCLFLFFGLSLIKPWGGNHYLINYFILF